MYIICNINNLGKPMQRKKGKGKNWETKNKIGKRIRKIINEKKYLKYIMEMK